MTRARLRLVRTAADERKRERAAARQARRRALEREGRGVYTVKPRLELLFDALAKSGVTDAELCSKPFVEMALTEALEAWAQWRLGQK